MQLINEAKPSRLTHPYNHLTWHLSRLCSGHKFSSAVYRSKCPLLIGLHITELYAELGKRVREPFVVQCSFTHNVHLPVETLRCGGVGVLVEFIILYVPIVLEADLHYFSLRRTVVRVGHFYLEQRSDYSHIRSTALTFNCPSWRWYRSGETSNTSQMCQNCPRKCAKLLARWENDSCIFA